mmetsp:Transcript_43408/g.94545  ORF Transcript_43408/g.94545 Transcript_43408/m.94545 type:complete len:336 (-) Transcript_43408:133-1140(-)
MTFKRFSRCLSNLARLALTEAAAVVLAWSTSDSRVLVMAWSSARRAVTSLASTERISSSRDSASWRTLRSASVCKELSCSTFFVTIVSTLPIRRVSAASACPRAVASSWSAPLRAVASVVSWLTAMLPRVAIPSWIFLSLRFSCPTVEPRVAARLLSSFSTALTSLVSVPSRAAWAAVLPRLRAETSEANVASSSLTTASSLLLKALSSALLFLASRSNWPSAAPANFLSSPEYEDLTFLDMSARARCSASSWALSPVFRCSVSSFIALFTSSNFDITRFCSCRSPAFRSAASAARTLSCLERIAAITRSVAFETVCMATDTCCWSRWSRAMAAS